jgi:thiol-disulfide isomerase/thioredoxin
LGFHLVKHGQHLTLHGRSPRSNLPANRGIEVVNLWAQWCGPCKEEAPVLRQAYPILQKRHVSLVGVDTEDDSKLGSAFARQQGWAWPQYFDQSGSTLHELAFGGLPETIITQDGEVVGYFLGPVVKASSLLAAVNKATVRPPSH